MKWDKEKDWLIASNVENLEAAGYPKIFTMDFSKNGFKAIGAEYFINSSDKSYDAELKKIEETTMTSSVRKGDNFYWFSESGSQEHSNYAAILIATDEILSDESIPWVNSLDRIVSDIATSQRQTIQLVFYRDKDSTKRGMDVSQDKLVLNATKNILEDKNGKPVVFDITLWFNEEYNDLINKEVEEVTNGDDKKFDFVIMDAETLTENETKFYTALFKYSKPIMMFLIFVVIMYTGIYSIMTNQDAKARVLVKEKVKHILIGVVMFACVVMILWLCKSFMEANFAKIQEVTESNIESTVDVVEADIEQSWFVEILTTFINSIAEMVKWLRVSILAKVVGNGQAAEPFDLVFNSGQAVDYTLAPFSKIEWERYMYGYRALEALALALVAIALIKVSAEHVINAGNSEKIAESKQAILRMGIAMLCIVLGPYIVRLILTLFNYLLILVPLKDIELELAFGSGIVASVAGVMYQWVLLKIYFVFLVRKLMITFMLLLTPVVFGLWAISNKFRSLSLWIGELVTNSATQLCYALVFFVGSLIMFSGQSDFITLILVMMFMQLADFFKDSLQGLVQKWGGINETGVAEGLASGVLSVGKQTINYSTKASKFIGGTLQERSKTIDPERVTDKGRRMYNVGAVMRGDIFGLESKSKMNKNVSKKYEVHARENEEIVRSEKKKAAAQSEEYQKHFNDVFEGREQYDPNKEYYNDTQKHAYQSADKARKAEDKAARLRKGIQEADEEAKNTRTIKERIQDKVKENALKNSERDLGSFETLDDFRKATSQIGKSFNESSDSLAKKEASLDIMKQMKEERRGAVSNEQVKSICKSAIQEIAQLEASNNDKDKVANITTSIKQKIAEALQDVGTLDGELKDVRDEYQKVPNNTNVNSPEYIKYAATRDKRREDMQDSFKLKKS